MLALEIVHSAIFQLCDSVEYGLGWVFWLGFGFGFEVGLGRVTVEFGLSRVRLRLKLGLCIQVGLTLPINTIVTHKPNPPNYTEI